LTAIISDVSTVASESRLESSKIPIYLQTIPDPPEEAAGKNGSDIYTIPVDPVKLTFIQRIGWLSSFIKSNVAFSLRFKDTLISIVNISIFSVALIGVPL